MSDEKRRLPIALDALSYPLVRFGWWLLMALCAACFLVLLAISTSGEGRILINGRIVFAAVALVGLVVRCYFTIIEHTLTDWGKALWQDTSVNTDGLWSSMLSLVGLACISWAPLLVLHYQTTNLGEWREIVFQGIAALGCEYFCMGTLALVVFDNFAQVLPHRVLPAIFKSGPAFMLGSAALVLVPMAFELTWGMLPPTMSVFARALSASTPTAFFMIVHARLIGLLYVANRERIGWEG